MNLELGAGRRLTAAGGSSAVCPGTDVENRRNPEKENKNVTNEHLQRRQQNLRIRNKKKLHLHHHHHHYYHPGLLIPHMMKFQSASLKCS